MSLADAIQKARPALSASSVRTYVSILSSLHKKCIGGELEVQDFNDTAKFIKFLKDKTAASRKTVLSALFILTTKPEYRAAMVSDIDTYNADVKSQVMSEKQKAAAISLDDVKAVLGHLAVRAAEIYKKKAHTVSDLLAIQDYILLTLMAGSHIAPRRSLDYCAFKIKNIDIQKDNYLDKGQLIFNTFKTAKTYGKQEVPCPPELKKILTRWFKINPTEHLLFNSKLEPLSSPQITQMFNRIFNGKKVSTNQIRHAYLTERFSAYSKEQKVVDETMKNMGSSPAVLSSYVRV